MPEKSISKTAYYCCGARFKDAESINPVCGDYYAKVFMDNTAMDIFKKFDDKKLSRGKAAGATRHRIIDDFLREKIRENPDEVIILIGAGFDTRAYRIPGGRWLEIDDPHIISLKNKQLPASKCKNSLERISYDYKCESLEDKIPLLERESSITVVVEGVLFYLLENEIQDMLNVFRFNIPTHTLICDLQTQKFFHRYNKPLSEIMGTFGSPFRINTNKPEEIFIRNGYRIMKTISIIEKTVDFGKIRIPKILLKTFYNKIKHGYSVFVFNL